MEALRVEADESGARAEEYKGKVRVMAIMTGVQSAQILGPSTQKQADRSRASINGEAAAPTSGPQSDGGQDELEKNNGLDVIR